MQLNIFILLSVFMLPRKELVISSYKIRIILVSRGTILDFFYNLLTRLQTIFNMYAKVAMTQCLTEHNTSVQPSLRRGQLSYQFCRI